MHSSGYRRRTAYGSQYSRDESDEDDDVSLQQKLTQVASEYEMKKKLEVGKLKNRILALTNENSRKDTQIRANQRVRASTSCLTAKSRGCAI